MAVPPSLTDARDANSIAAAVNTDFGTSITGGQITPQALALLQAKAPGGSYFIPSASPNSLTLQQDANADTIIQGPNSRFTADQVNGNIDYNFSARDRLAAKYYFQNDPNAIPFAQSQLLGFPQTMKAGGQAFSLDNTTAFTPNLTVEQRLGFIREIAYSKTGQSLTPADAQINLPGLSLFPTINIKYADNAPSTDSLSIGPVNNFANAGVFQNNFEGASNLKWIHGRYATPRRWIADVAGSLVYGLGGERSPRAGTCAFSFHDKVVGGAHGEHRFANTPAKTCGSQESIHNPPCSVDSTTVVSHYSN